MSMAQCVHGSAVECGYHDYRMRIALGADHAGVALKRRDQAASRRARHRVHRLRHQLDRVGGLSGLRRRPSRAKSRRARSTAASSCAAPASAWRSPPTKSPGIRAAAVVDEASARLSREHNDATCSRSASGSTPPDQARAHRRRVSRHAVRRRPAPAAHRQDRRAGST